MSEQEPKQTQPTQPDPEPGWVSILVKVVAGIFIGGLVLAVLVLGTCAIMINWR